MRRDWGRYVLPSSCALLVISIVGLGGPACGLANRETGALLVGIGLGIQFGVFLKWLMARGDSAEQSKPD